MPGDTSEEGEVERNDEPTPGRKFTWQELSRLNKRHNVHIAYRGKVYNVSEFVSRHPGGVDQIMLGAGRDITQIFESYHRLDVAKTMDKYYAGELVTNEVPVFPRPGKFYETLKERVGRYFKKNNIDPKIDYWMFFRYLIFIASALGCWAGVLRFHSSWILGVMFSIGWGLFSAFLAVTCFHDASHFSITHKPWVWKMVGFIHDCCVGTSVLIWTYRHTMGHHPYTNIDGSDPDIATVSPDALDFWRIKREQHWFPRYFYQHIYCPALYCFLGTKIRLEDLLIIFTHKHNAVRVNDPSLSQWIIFLTSKVTYCILRFYIPYHLMPLSALIFYNVLMEIVTSYWVAATLAPSHVIGEVEWPKPGKNNTFDRDWAEMQVASTQDYATDSWFWNVFSGGLNHQTTHHLFPGVIQSHYPKITPILKQTCEEFGIQYRSVDSLTEAFGCHIRHLHKLGRVTTEEKAKKNE